MNIKLKNIATLQLGLYAQPAENGSIPYIQAKQFDALGKLVSETDTFINPPLNYHNQILKDGDVLFVGKGFRIFAWTYRASFGEAIASSIFYIIRLDQSIIITEYLSIILNLPTNQSYFQQLGAGSSIPSIRKKELLEFEFPLLPIPQQQKVVELHKHHSKNIDLSSKLILEKEKLFQSVVSKLITTQSK